MKKLFSFSPSLDIFFYRKNKGDRNSEIFMTLITKFNDKINNVSDMSLKALLNI